MADRRVPRWPDPGLLRVIGLMSGTSLDGVDAALVELDDTDETLRWRLRAFHTAPYTPARRGRLRAAIEEGDAATLCRVDAELGEWLAAAARAVCREAGVPLAEVDLIGSHGQTVWHEPPVEGRRGATLQIGCAATIAERTGVPVVSDFRSRDVAAGGHGAPLVPWVDRLLFAAPDRTRILINIGGMANLTRVPPRGGDGPLVAFDTGPGVALIDEAVLRATDGARRFDRDGAMARSGTVDRTLLAELSSDPYFDVPPPKSTGRERFGGALVAGLSERYAPAGPDAWADLVATLTELTARSIADAVDRWAPGAGEVVVTGGGARNPVLMERLAAALGMPVGGGEALGIDPDAKEAVAFAALAWAHVRGLAANVPAATGADGPRVLGTWTPGGANPDGSGTAA